MFSPLHRLRTFRWVLGLVIAASLLNTVAVVRGPWRFYTKEFLFEDVSVSLLVASELNHGQRLYQDVAYPYGWIPAIIYALFTRVLGNTITIHLVFHAILSAFNIALVFLAIRRFRTAVESAIFLGVWLFPSLVIPAGVVAAYSNSLYLPTERLLITSIFLIWDHPADRSWKRAIALGAILGVWQGVKFGGAVFAGGAIVLLDMACLAVTRDRPKAVKHWILIGLFTSSVFFLLEVAQVAGAFLILPQPVAKDFVWPSYTAKLYETISAESKTVIVWNGVKYFVVQQLPYLLGIVAALIIIPRVVALSAREGRTRNEPALLFPILFYTVAAAGGYFGHLHTYYKYA